MATRREILKKAAAAAPGLIIGGAAMSGGRAGAAETAGPAAGKNLVLFITDQERAIQHFPEGWEQANLPGMTRLKQSGVSFENAFCNACMCSPSRASFFTGYFPAQHGVKYTLEEDMPAPKYPQVELSPQFKNLATVMSSAGYNVVYKGKWHMSKPAGRKFKPSDLLPYGFTRWDPPDAGANQDIQQEGGGKFNHDGRYMDGIERTGQEGALDYLTEAASQSQPFCLIVSLVNPHDVLLYPKNYVDGGYDDSWLQGDIQLPATNTEDLSTKPGCQEQFVRLFNATGKLDTLQKKLDYLNFYANLMILQDQYLVEILDALDTLGLTDDTVIVRTADHGEMGLAHGNMRQKNFNAYEETMRVPMIFSNKHLFAPGTTNDALVSHVDFVPTMAGLFGAPRRARAKWQGKDYSKLIVGQATKPVQDYVVFTFDDYQAGQANGPYIQAPQHVVAIREREWKIAKTYDAERKKPAEWELYDLKHDPIERINLADPGHPRTGREERHWKRLRKKLARVERTRLQPLPHQAFAIRSCRLDDGRVETRARVPGKGNLIQEVTTNVQGERVRIARKTRPVNRKGTVRMVNALQPDRPGAPRGSSAPLRVRTTFVPNGGTPNTVVRNLGR